MPYAPSDIRNLYVSLCILNATLTSATVIFLFFSLSNMRILFDPHASVFDYNIVSVVIAVVLFLSNSAAVLSTWFHLPRLEIPSIMCTTVFAFCNMFSLVWGISVATGRWNQSMAASFSHQFPNSTSADYGPTGTLCSDISDLMCCGWTVPCPDRCPYFGELCSEAAMERATDFSNKLLPVSGLIVGVSMGSLAALLYRRLSYVK